MDFAQIKASILQGVLDKRQEELKGSMQQKNAGATDTMPDISGELRALYPDITAYSLTKAYIKTTDTSSGMDTATIFYCKWNRPIKQQDTLKLRSWLQSRVKQGNYVLAIETQNRKIRRK